MIDFLKRKGNILLLLVVISSFWQIFFLQNGMKWDFVDAFLPSRYFFSESILNMQFPLWNPYLLYGTPIYADLVSVFNPEFWIVGNMFGYSNITLQYTYLLYIFIAGVSFRYFLKEFKTEHNLALGLSIAYMLSGFSIGNAQHLAFISSYAILPFTAACYIKFLRRPEKPTFFRLAIALFLMIYCSYPAITVILGYFFVFLFIYNLVSNWKDKKHIKKLIIYHSVLLVVVLLFSSVLIVAFLQSSPFLSRYSGLSVDLVQKHPFSLRSFLSFLLPMATGNDTPFFETDHSMSNGYWGIISVVLFLFSLTKKVKNKESYIILFFGVLSLLASLGNQFFLREFLYNYAPLMDMFKYPALFRAFTIFCFLAFIGVNGNFYKSDKTDKILLLIFSVLVLLTITILMWKAKSQLQHFAFFSADKSFTEELLSSTRFDNIIFQGIFQIIILLLFVLTLWKAKSSKHFYTVLLFLFVFDGIISTQLSTNYTVISDDNPIKFSNYLKSSPKGFPIPELNPIGENSDKNAQNEFIWINNNVFPKKVTFDGLVSFKLDGYSYLADHHPDLLEAIKKEPVVYFSSDIRENSSIDNFNTNSVFLSTSDYNFLQTKQLRSNKNDKLTISDFSPQHIEIKTTTSHPQLLIYQQNYYKGWKVYVDGNEQDLIKSNFAHMATLVPAGEHSLLFKYENQTIKYTFYFGILIFFILIAFSIYYYLVQNPEKKNFVALFLTSIFFIFILTSLLNRHFYQKNKKGLTPVITEKLDDWRKKYNTDIRILLSTQNEELKNLQSADTTCFIDEKTNLSELSHFLINSESKYFAFAWQGAIINDDLFELIYSFYPKIVEHKKNNNSGMLLLEKTTSNQNYHFIQTFESEEFLNSSRANERIMLDSVSGNHSYYYNNNDKYGQSIQFPAEEEMIKQQRISILADFMFEEEIIKTFLVFTTERDGKTQLWEAAEIDKFAKYPNQWNRVVLGVNLNPKIQKGDKIKIYFWNRNKARFQIDNIKLKFHKSKS